MRMKTFMKGKQNKKSQLIKHAQNELCMSVENSITKLKCYYESILLSIQRTAVTKNLDTSQIPSGICFCIQPNKCACHNGTLEMKKHTQ